MAETIDPVTGKVVLNLITRTHVSRLVLQSLLTVLVKTNPQLAGMVIEDLERRREAARDPNIPISPPPSRIAIGLNPKKNAASATPPSAASPTPLTADLPSFQMAIAITEMTAALMPSNTDPARGRAPNRT